MKPAILTAALAALSISLVANCKKSEPKGDDNLQPAVVTDPGAAHPTAGAAPGHGAPAGHAAAAEAPPSGGKTAEGTVSETMNSGGYTYVLVATGGEEIWTAGPETAVKVGDKVSFSNGMPMADFPSSTLKRTFDMVYLVPSFVINGAAAAPVAKAPGAPAPGAVTMQVEIKGIKKVKDGKTVAELFAEKDKMGGKSVKVRGIVVKYNAGIMGSNWIHLKDGSGSAGSDDLTVTTQATAKVGDTVIIDGMVALDKNFGAGYRYNLIVENAKVTVE